MKRRTIEDVRKRAKEAQKRYRDKMRKEGYVQKQVWIKKVENNLKKDLTSNITSDTIYS